MAKKLKVEVEADAAPARRELQKLDGTVSRSTSNLRATARVFAGMGIKMAANFAAQHMQQGSAGQAAVGVGGGVLSGALQGSAAGPWGAVAGGIMGAVTALQELSAASKQAAEAERERREAIEKMQEGQREVFADIEKAEKRTAEFRDTLKSLTNITGDDNRRAAIMEALAAKREELRVNGDAVVGATHEWNGNEKGFRKALEERSTIKSELSQLEALLDKKGSPAPRANESALDALTRLGATFGGGDYSREQLALQQETNTILTRIEQKTGVSSSAFDK